MKTGFLLAHEVRLAGEVTEEGEDFSRGEGAYPYQVVGLIVVARQPVATPPGRASQLAVEHCHELDRLGLRTLHGYLGGQRIFTDLEERAFHFRSGFGKRKGEQVLAVIGGSQLLGTKILR